MSKLPVSNLVDVTINLIGAAQSVDGFGTPMIIDTENVKGAGALVPVLTTCYTLQDLLDAGYSTHSKAYVLLLHLLSYSPKRVKKVIVASVAATSSAELTAVENANSAWYLMLVTSRASADLQTCATWTDVTAARRHVFVGETQDSTAFSTAPSVLSILETANRVRSAIVARKADPQIVTLTMSGALAAADSITMKVNGVTPAGFPVVYGVSNDATLAAIAAVLAGEASIDTATTAGSGNDRVITLTAANPLIPMEITEFACSGAVGPATNVTCAILETDPGAGAADAELAGLLIPQGLGQSTAAGKTLNGLTADDLTPTEYNNATGHGGNVYVTYGAISQVQRGQTSGFVAPGAHAFLDTIFVRDRLESEIQTAVLAVLAPQVGKLPFNNQGIAAVAGAAIAVCNQFVTLEMLEPFNVSDDWTIPDISQVAPADKTARNLPGISANLVGTGAIQSVALTVNITV